MIKKKKKKRKHRVNRMEKYAMQPYSEKNKMKSTWQLNEACF